MKTRRHAQRRSGRVLLLTALAAGCASLPGSGNHSRAQIRGQVVSRSSGEPIACSVPLVVMAIPTAAVPPPASAATVFRRVAGAFSPSLLVVPVGRSVQIVNDDEICHSFFSSSPDNAFDLGLLQPGTSATVRFESSGAVQVYCSLHTGKQATILVAPTAHFAVVGATGAFEIDTFDPGAYVLETWTEAGALQRLDVTVPPRRTKFVEITVDERQLQGSE